MVKQAIFKSPPEGIVKRIADRICNFIYGKKDSMSISSVFDCYTELFKKLCAFGMDPGAARFFDWIALVNKFSANFTGLETIKLSEHIGSSIRRGF